ncbi:hypothetical protein H5119_00375, partial [Pseudoalteromonas sp. SG45-5]|uniref:FimV/HubP family polar landmark protein n=1 Tax=unclassified Pseudoalteromonas TaxID=194690 RepID=UPI0017E3DA4C
IAAQTEQEFEIDDADNDELLASSDENSVDDEFDNELEEAEETQPLDLDDSQETALDEQTSATAEPLQEDDLDDDLLIDDELAELGSELENELGDDDELVNAPPTALDEELPENVDADTKGVSVSQTEQDLANALAAESSLDSLEDDFDDELLLDNDFTDLDAELENPDIAEPTASEYLDEELSDELVNEQTNVDREAEITQSKQLGSSDIASDDELDDEFMAELTNTDFDSLLNELAEPEELSIDDSSEFDVDFDSLLKEDLGIDEPIIIEEPQVESSDVEQLGSDEFVDIDSLLEESDDAELEHEPYNDVNMDVGLGEFDALLAGENPTDVDAESGGYSAKLDLARAYIEIDDSDSALKVIEDVINKGPEEVQEEALSLKAKLK